MESTLSVRAGSMRVANTLSLAALVAAAGIFAAPTAALAAVPDFGPNVLIFDPSMPSSQIQSALDAISTTAEFGTERHAVLFKPGIYSVNAQVGYYTSVAGLGRLPDEVVINGGMRVEGRINSDGATDSALTNFWRSIENLSITPAGGTTRWAVSQASPMRRVHIRGGITLFPAWWGYSSGGFIADSMIDDQVQSGPQQQWYSRDSVFGSWSGSVWNMVFSGVQGASAQSFPSPPMTTLATTPRSREKPFLYLDSAGKYRVFKPDLRTAASGTTWALGGGEGKAIPIEDFLIARPSTSAATINLALARGRNIIFTPGVYRLAEPLNVTHRDTVLLGLGMATLVPASGKAAITTSDSEGISISGLIIDAGPINSPVLLQIGARPGNGVAHGREDNPILLSDVFFRIGGATAGSATTSLEVNSPDVILDDIWAWRADHGTGVAWTANVAEHGVIVNGDEVTALGLFVEHYQKTQVIWNGNGGQTIFYQSELPYDPPSQEAWMNGAVKGYPSYAVGPSVRSHQGTGMGVYSFFNAGQPIVETSAITIPVTPGVTIKDAVSVFLSGSGEISHVVNQSGAAANAASYISYLLNN
jgi:hypothetical protein